MGLGGRWWRHAPAHQVPLLESPGFGYSKGVASGGCNQDLGGRGQEQGPKAAEEKERRRPLISRA